MRTKPMSREHQALLRSLIDQRGAPDLIRWITKEAGRKGKNKIVKVGKSGGRPSAPENAERLKNRQFFFDVGQAVGGPFDPAPPARSQLRRKLDAAIEIVAKRWKLGPETAKRYYRDARAEFLTRTDVVVVVGNSEPEQRQKIARRLAAWRPLARGKI